ncbi:right-handed parallel beta-helix repeat-containing protein [bacterium]|nr:right-handed parallel beta-helix repeat-containing protein [bacterium]
MTGYRLPITGFLALAALSLALAASPAFGFASVVELFEDTAYTDISDTFLTRDVIYIRVTDTDENVDTNSRDTVWVTVYTADDANGLILDTETIYLTENMEDSGVFLDTAVPLRVTDTVAPSVGDGQISWGRSDTLHVAYADEDDGADNSFDTALALEIASSALAQIFEDAANTDEVDTLLTRDLMYIRVTDTDENRNPQSTDTLTVTAYVGDNAAGLVIDTETLVLTESSNVSGLFKTAAVEVTDTKVPVVNDGIVSWGAGDTVHVVYTDVTGTGESVFDTALALEIASAATLAFFEDAAFTDGVDTYTSQDTIYVQVTDADENRNPQSKDTVSATVYLGDGTAASLGLVLDTETVVLTESAETTGIFRSSAMIVAPWAAPGIGNGKLVAEGSDTLHIAYTDVTGASETASDTALILRHYNGPNWYVNDASTTGDGLTSAVGADTNTGESSAPFRTIIKAMVEVASGETINIDAGLYDSYTIVNGSETAGVNIDKDSIALVGKDSGATVIDPPGPKTVSGLYGIYADTQVGLTIKNIGVTGAYDGVHFYNVDNSTVESDSASSCGNYGIYLRVNSDTNTVKNNTASSNTSLGIFLNSSSNNTVSNNTANSNSNYGINLTSSSNNTVSNNTVSSSSNGIYLNSSSNSNTVSNNTANSNTFGIYLYTNSSNNTVSNNTANSNTYGIYLVSNTNNNTLSNNTANSNSIYGIYLSLSSNNTVSNNTANSNSDYGIYLSSSSNNTVVQNDVRNNTQYQIYIEGSSSSNTVRKNNIASGANPDSGVYNSTANSFDFSRNWWNSTDSSRIDKLFFDTGGVNRIIWQPFRLGEVDTTAGADTVAPKAPDTVAVVGSSDTSVHLGWAASDTNEDADAGAFGLNGYNLYRSETKDTSSWTLIAQPSSTGKFFEDTDVKPGRTYYYRVTAIDNASPRVNESFYSDSQPGDTATFSSRVNWYVNDASVLGDVYTSAVGSNTTGDGTTQKPFATITKALSLATAGDTVFIDAGLYAETVVIDADSISLVGKDSNATVIDPPSGNGIFADTQSGLLIKNLGVKGAIEGIYFVRVTNSTIEGDSLSHNAGRGIYFQDGSDSNTVRNSNFYFNLNQGVYLVTNCFNNTIDNNIAVGNSQGFHLNSSSRRNILTRNISRQNANGIYIEINSHDNVVRNNTVASNAQSGLSVIASDNNVVYQNDISLSDTGVSIQNTSSGNLFTRNNITNNIVNHLLNQAATSQRVARNWYGTTQEDQIALKFTDTGWTFKPYRLGPVDTTAGADTSAPYLFDTSIVLTAGNETVQIRWDTPTQDEDSQALTGFASVGIFRLTVKDSTHWDSALIKDVAAGPNSYIDTGLTNNVTYYYRLTASDGITPFENESFFTDTKSAKPVWSDLGVSIVYVSQFGDSSDPESADTSKAFRNINEAVSKLNPSNGWDTIIVFNKSASDSYFQQIDLTLDTGLHLVSYKKRFGADTGGGPDTWAKIAFDTGTVVKATSDNIIEGFFIDGIDSTASAAQGLVVSAAEHNGVFLTTASSGIRVQHNDIKNLYFGVAADSSNFDFVMNNHIHQIARDAVHFDNGSQNNVIAENTVENQREATSHGHGIKLKTNTSNNVVRDNVVRRANFAVEIVSSGGGNRVYHNDISNSDTGLWLSAAGADSFVKNNVTGMKPTLLDDFSASPNFDARRNWWGSSNINTVLGGMVNDTSVKLFPIRITAVDTRTITADTAAPEPPDTVTLNGLSTTGGQIIVTWDTPDLDDEGSANPGGFGAYNIYRSTSPDTEDWKNNFIAQVASGVTSFTDLNLTDGVTYYYRMTASETLAGGYINKSVFSDTKSAAPQIDTAGPNTWYVNDTSTTGDSFTSAVGSDANSGVKPNAPLRKIQTAVNFASAGDTIFVDAGTYSETIVIDTDNFSIIGKDSNATVIYSPSSGANGIYADTQTGLTIKNLAVTGASNGIKFVNVDQSTISGDSVSGNASNGIVLSQGSDTNTITENFTEFQTAGCGIYLEINSNNNTISRNRSRSNDNGIYLWNGSNLNQIIDNTVLSNTTSGIILQANSSRNTIVRNLVKSTVNQGIFIDNSDTNVVALNDLTANDTGLRIDGAAFANIITKNNLAGNIVSSVFNKSGVAQTLSRNWFGTTDEVALDADFEDTASAFRPYRLGLIDTAAGADTTAPSNVTGAATDVSSGVNVVLTWAVPTLQEETSGGTLGFTGAKIYRLTNSPDTSNWGNASLLVKTTAAADTTWTDTNVAVGNTYYYRLSSFDAASRVNASFFLDTLTALVAVPAWTGPVWYVDKDTGADTYTGHPNFPFKTIQGAIAGIPADSDLFDTILLDKNTYAETVVIDTDYIWIQGVDSGATGTVIDSGATDSGVANKYGIFADTQSNLVIKSLRVANMYRGINFLYVDNSRIEDVTVINNYENGINVADGSDTNTITKNMAQGNGFGTNDNQGIGLGGTPASSNNTVRQNYAVGNSAGIILFQSAVKNTIDSNTASSNATEGFVLEGSSSNNTLAYNVSQNNSGAGLSITGAASTNNVIRDNQSLTNGGAGISLDTGSNNNLFFRNLSDNNGGAGFDLTNADTNTFIQNESRRDLYGVKISASAGGDNSQNNKFVRGNILKPDSYGIYLANSQADTPFFWRNFMDTTNEGSLTDVITTSRSLFGLVRDVFDLPGLALAADTQPRFAMVDTSLSGDSLAPERPSPLTAVDSGAGSARIRWTAPTVNEDGGAATADFTGFKIYRTTNPSEKDWKTNAFRANAASASDTEFLDLTVTSGVTYYYRVTAVDAAAFVNESYFTDSLVVIPGSAFSDLGAMTVYVSGDGDSTNPTVDTPGTAFGDLIDALAALNPLNGYDTIVVFSSADNVGNDSYSIANNGGKGAVLDTGLTLISRKALFGSDTGGGGDTYPTVFWGGGAGSMIVIDSGARVEGFVIDGRDSSLGLKVVEINGSNSGLPAILRKNTVRNANYAVWVGAAGDNFTIESCTATAISKSAVEFNGNDGIIRNCLIDNVADTGIFQASGGNATIVDNIIRNIGGHGIDVEVGGNRIFRNTVRNVERAGVRVGSGSSFINANDIHNADTGVLLESPASSMEVSWNNITSTVHKLIQVVGSGNTITHNYFGTTDMQAISDSVISGFDNFAPFRFAVIDTKTASDTIAPSEPDTVTTDATVAGQVTVRWQPPPESEDGGPAGTISGYRVYRQVNSPDTTNWKALTQLSDTSATDTFIIDASVSAGNTYYYRVLAFDPAGNDGWMADTVSAVPIFGGSGSVRFVTSGGLDTTQYKAKASVAVVVEVNDSDGNANTGVKEGVNATIVNVTLGTDTEIISCTELTANSTIFSGTVTLSVTSGDGTPNNGLLYVRAGDQIKVTYTDLPSGPSLTDVADILAGGSGGDTVVIVGEQHFVISGSGPAVLEMQVKDSAGVAVPGVTVSFSVEYDGAAASGLNTSGTASDTGYLRQSLSLTSGDGVYAIVASSKSGDSDDATFVVMTDKRKVPAHATESPKSKWVMIAPMKKPVSASTALGQLSYGGTGNAYWHEPSLTNATGTFKGYYSMTGNEAHNVSSNGTVSIFEIGRGYWFRSSSATSVGLSGSPSAQTDTWSVKLTSGMNMIGNPFTHYINWMEDVAIDTNLNDTPNPLPIASISALNLTYIDTRLQWRDQSAEQYVNPISSSDSMQLKPWVGFWVKANTSCSIVYYPNKRIPQSVTAKQQAPKYTVSSGNLTNWLVRLMAHSGNSGIKDEYTFVGVAPAASDGEDMNDLWKAPGMLGDLQVLVGEARSASSPQGGEGKYYAASIAAPIKEATAWPVVVTAPPGLSAATLSWDLASLPQEYGAYMLGGPSGPVDLRGTQSLPLSLSPSLPLSLTLAVGLPEYLAPFLAAPLSKDNTFVYPNPGPDAAGNMSFKYNLQTAADISLKIFDMGGKLVREQKGSGIAGSNTITWDGTNKAGQKLGSGAYIYILESNGTKLIDKLAIVR